MPSSTRSIRKLKAAPRKILAFAASLIHKRRYISIPMEGIIFVIVTLLIGLAAMNTSAQLLFLVFSMMCSFWILSALLATTTMRGLRVWRKSPRLAVAGQPTRVLLHVENRKRLAGSWSLRVNDRLATGETIGAAFFPHVPRRGDATQSYECIFPRRGLQKFASLAVATRFPFGLIERTLFFRDPAEILVLPGAIVLDDRILRQAQTDLGDQEVNAKGHGAGLYGLRRYRPGDPSRDIHWKVTARTGRLTLREYESEERRRGSVLFDNRLPHDANLDDREEFEKGLLLASSILGLLSEIGHEFELLTATGKVPAGQGPGHLTRCRRALALLEPESMSKPSPLQKGPENDSVWFWVGSEATRSQAPGRASVVRIEEYEADLERALNRSRESEEIEAIREVAG
ncbi:MAG: DUF58 domain-containing protein [Sumerlaeia bacterium]